MTRPRRSTLIRQARQAAIAAKRCEISSNKKAPPQGRAYNSSAAGAPEIAPVAIHSHTTARCMNNEFEC